MLGSRNGTSTNDRVLRIYVASHCSACRESRRVARMAASRLPALRVEVVDIDQQEPLDEIFAVPSFCYRGHIVSLGNPRQDALVMRVLNIDRAVEGTESLTADPRDSAPEIQEGTGPAEVLAPSQPPILRAKGRLVAACCRALGLTSSLLCSLTMIPPALGQVATGRPESSMGGTSHSGSVGGKTHGEGDRWRQS